MENFSESINNDNLADLAETASHILCINIIDTDANVSLIHALLDRAITRQREQLKNAMHEYTNTMRTLLESGDTEHYHYNIPCNLFHASIDFMIGIDRYTSSEKILNHHIKTDYLPIIGLSAAMTMTMLECERLRSDIKGVINKIENFVNHPVDTPKMVAVDTDILGSVHSMLSSALNKNVENGAEPVMDDSDTSNGTVH